MELESGAVAPVAGVPPAVAAGQVLWAPPPAPGGSAPPTPPRGFSAAGALVFAAWSESGASTFGVPRRFGSAHCMRPAGIYLLPAPLPPPTTAEGAKEAPPPPPAAAAAVLLTPSFTSAYSPRLSPDAATLVFLSADRAIATGAHVATWSLHKLAWPPLTPSGGLVEPTTVIPVVSAPATSGAFPGLYVPSLVLPRQPFLDADTLLLDTVWRADLALLEVALTSGRVTRVSGREPGSWQVLAVAGRGPRALAVALHSTPFQPTRLMLARWAGPSAAGGPDAPWAWVPAADETQVRARPPLDFFLFRSRQVSGACALFF